MLLWAVVPTTVNFQSLCCYFGPFGWSDIAGAPTGPSEGRGVSSVQVLSVSEWGRGVSGLWGQTEFPGQVLAAVQTLLLIPHSSPMVSGQGREVSGPRGQKGSQAKLLVVVGPILLVLPSHPHVKSPGGERSFRPGWKKCTLPGHLLSAEIPIDPSASGTRLSQWHWKDSC